MNRNFDIVNIGSGAACGTLLQMEARSNPTDTRTDPAAPAEANWATLSDGKKRILILGGGFAGAFTAKYLQKRLRGAPDVEIALISKENFVLFTPMLHEVAGSDLAVTDIVQPLRKMLHRTRVGIAEVETIDLIKKQVRIRQKDLPHPYEVSYDQLVVALGAVTNFYHTPGLEAHALTMKTLGDAIHLRNCVIDALELADNQVVEAERKKTLTVVVAGGGFAGIETAGSLTDFLLEAIRSYPRLKKDMIRVVVVHAGDHILPELGMSLGHYAREKLCARGVEVRLNAKVCSYDNEEVALDDGTKIPSRMLIWTAGTTPAPVLSGLPCLMQRGRVVANECMQVPNFPGVWALGDCALVPDPSNPGGFYPPTAQHATRMAPVLANNIVETMRGMPPQPFRFKTQGMLGTIGRRAAVAEILGVKFSGIIAWFLWRAIYLGLMPGWPKKVRVALDWTLDLFFSKDIVQLPTLQGRTISEREDSRLPPVEGDNGQSNSRRSINA
jgi:NADH:ubiquinone reductase (H+-translocating)